MSSDEVLAERVAAFLNGEMTDEEEHDFVVAAMDNPGVLELIEANGLFRRAGLMTPSPFDEMRLGPDSAWSRSRDQDSLATAPPGQPRWPMAMAAGIVGALAMSLYLGIDGGQSPSGSAPWVANSPLPVAEFKNTRSGAQEPLTVLLDPSAPRIYFKLLVPNLSANDYELQVFDSADGERSLTITGLLPSADGFVRASVATSQLKGSSYVLKLVANEGAIVEYQLAIARAEREVN